MAEGPGLAARLGPILQVGPFRLKPEHAAHEGALGEALVDDLYARTKPAVVALLLVLVVLRRLLDPIYAEHRHVRWAFAAVVALSLLRLASCWFFGKSRGPLSPRFQVFAGGSLLMGLAFAALNVAAYPLLTPVRISLLAACHTGIMSSALMSMGSSPLAYALFLLPNLGSIAFMIARDGRPWESWILLLLIAIYGPAVLIMGLLQYASRRNTILLSLQLEESAVRDGLTGLANRRYLAEFMEREQERILRTWESSLAAGGDAPGKSLCLIIFDLDHFKEVNDSFGHLAGDAVLKQFAGILNETIRAADIAVRWGGEEFVVVARDAETEAPVLIRRIRERVKARRFRLPSGETIGRTCSVGYAFFPMWSQQPRLVGWERVLDVADAALYHAKQTGRDRSVGARCGDAPWRWRDANPETVRDLRRAVEDGLLRLVE
jgi:diguanylate cyclase (GGDEF)-like protein